MNVEAMYDSGNVYNPVAVESPSPAILQINSVSQNAIE